MKKVKKYLICPGELGGKKVSAEELITEHNLDPEECCIAPPKVDGLWVICPGLGPMDELKRKQSRKQYDFRQKTKKLFWKILIGR